MDVKTIISDAKARFNHNSAKEYLKEKYTSKLLIADQSGLWKANLETINFLNTQQTEFVVLMDIFDNPVKVNRLDLLTKLSETYNTVMHEWFTEWTDLEKKR
jgi:hypothetical protein